jgi:hypothetical protein
MNGSYADFSTGLGWAVECPMLVCEFNGWPQHMHLIAQLPELCLIVFAVLLQLVNAEVYLLLSLLCEPIERYAGR